MKMSFFVFILGPGAKILPYHLLKLKNWSTWQRQGEQQSLSCIVQVLALRVNILAFSPLTMAHTPLPRYEGFKLKKKRIYKIFNLFLMRMRNAGV